MKRPLRPVPKILTALSLLLAGAISARTADVVEYVVLDGVGNVRVVTDEKGNVLERHDYLAFGEECTTGKCSSNPGVGAAEPLKFTGKERDQETGLDYFGARYYGSKIGRFTTVDLVYTIQENLLDPQRWNRYAYVRNNPLRHTDPDGRVIDTVVDVGFITYDVSDLVATYRSGNTPTGTQWLALGGDVLGAAIPFATGIGAAIRGGSKVEHAIEAERAASGIIDAGHLRRGRESEARVLDAVGETKNTAKVKGCEGCSIPDYQNPTTIGEMKDAKRVTDSPQLRIQREAAAKSGREHVVTTGTNTRVSGTVERQSTVRRRDDLGPQ